MFPLTISLIFLLLSVSAFGDSSSCSPTCVNGLCQDSTGTCSCFEGNFDVDCSITATKILIGRAQGVQPGQAPAYFYFPIDSAPGDLSFTIEKPSGISLQLEMILQALDNSSVPSNVTTSKILIPSTSLVYTTRNIPKSMLRDNIGRAMILVRISSSDGSLDDVTVNGVISTSSGSSIMDLNPIGLPSIIAPIGGTIFTILVIGCIVIKVRAQNAQSRFALAVAVASRAAPIPVYDPNEIEKFFPSVEFSKLTDPLHKGTCCICLEDFGPESICMQLYCKHVHHSDCIKKWLEKHATCPECRMSMTTEAIKKHFEGKKEGDKPAEEEALIPSQQTWAAAQLQTTSNNHVHVVEIAA